MLFAKCCKINQIRVDDLKGYAPPNEDMNTLRRDFKNMMFWDKEVANYKKFTKYSKKPQDQ
jgi:hypothetical protein